MINIFTSVVNRPEFVEIQKKTFDKFLKEEYQFHVIDDSLEESISNKFKEICKENQISYYRKPQGNRSLNESRWNGARHACETIQWTYDNLIKAKYCNDLVLFLDSDMFLLDHFSMVDHMEGEIISGLKQGRGKVEYMWNGIMFFNMPKIVEIDPDLNFSDGLVEGEMTDIGGHLYYYFKKNNISLKDTGVDYPTHYNDLDLQKDASGFNMELHLDGKFLHYRAGTNWHTQENWKTSKDPLKMKEEIFNQIVGDLIQ